MNTREPKYWRIVNEILLLIERGDLKPGDVVASERELMMNYGVSRDTVVRAMNELAKRKVVERIQGKGTYVAAEDAPSAVVLNKAAEKYDEALNKLFELLCETDIGAVIDAVEEGSEELYLWVDIEHYVSIAVRSHQDWLMEANLVFESTTSPKSDVYIRKAAADDPHIMFGIINSIRHQYEISKATERKG